MRDQKPKTLSVGRKTEYYASYAALKGLAMAVLALLILA
jgi:hypothetical protein